MVTIGLTIFGAELRAGEAAAPAAQPTPQQRAAQLQQWLKASQAQLRAYQWIETTAVTMDGEEKSRIDRKSTRLNSSHGGISRMPSSA